MIQVMYLLNEPVDDQIRVRRYPKGAVLVDTKTFVGVRTSEGGLDIYPRKAGAKNEFVEYRVNQSRDFQNPYRNAPD